MSLTADEKSLIRFLLGYNTATEASDRASLEKALLEIADEYTTTRIRELATRCAASLSQTQLDEEVISSSQLTTIAGDVNRSTLSQSSASYELRLKAFLWETDVLARSLGVPNYRREPHSLYIVRGGTLVNSLPGIQGIQGIQGEKGDKGDRGERGGVGLPDREMITFNTGTIATNTAMTTAQLLGKSALINRIETSHPAWVRIYNAASSMSADSDRPITRDPEPGSGVICEVLTAATNLAINLSPVTIGSNAETVITENLYLRVTNRDTVSRDITVTITFITIEM